MSHPITQNVNAIRRRLVRHRVATGACWVAAATLAAACVLGLSDYLFRYFDPGLRLMATAILVGIAIWSVWCFLVPFWRRPISTLVVSQRIESAFPQLNDRLSSSLDFLQQAENDPTAGSPALRRAVVTETSTVVEDLPLARIVDGRPLLRAAGGVALVLAIVLGAIVVDFESVGTAMHRLVLPLGSTQWPRVHQLRFQDPPQRLAVGQPFEVELIDQHGKFPGQVKIHYRHQTDRGHRLESIAMQQIGDMMVARRDSVQQSFEFRATGGDDLTMPWHFVEVVEPPRMASLDLLITPPAYTGLPTLAVEKNLHLLEGTKIELSAGVDRAVQQSRLCFDAGEMVSIPLTSAESGDQLQEFRLSRSDWMPNKSGSYWLEFEDIRGLVGKSERWQLRVVNDSPPLVSWGDPMTDLWVVPQAIVPVRVNATDNLRIRSIEVAFSRAGQTDQEAQVKDLYHGPDRITGLTGSFQDQPGEVRTAALDWPLESLGLEPGDQVTLLARASDYRPGRGEAASSRRLTIITQDELEQRIADRLAQIARRLEQALSLQRTTRESVGRLAIQIDPSGQLAEASHAALQATEFNQRRIARQLGDSREGVPADLAALTRELEINQLQASEIRQRVQTVKTELAALTVGPLSQAGHNLTAARRFVENPESQTSQLGDNFTTAAAGQAAVIDTLEKLLDELARWAGYERFAREVAQLQSSQLELRDRTRDNAIADDLQGGQPESRSSRDLRGQVAESQAELSRRFEKLMHDIANASRDETGAPPPAAETMANTVAVARQLGTGVKLRDATRQIRQNHMGLATELQEQVADDLEQLLEELRNRREHDLEKRVAGLREAERKLADVQNQLRQLRTKIESGESTSQAVQPGQEKQKLTREAQELEQRTHTLSRQLKRLQAGQAGQNTDQAARQLQTSAGPPSGRQARAAEQDLGEAARQLADARRRAEQELAQQQTEALQEVLREAVARQARVLDQTQQLDQQRNPDEKLSLEQTQAVGQLASQESQLVDQVQQWKELAKNLGAFQFALSKAGDNLQQATDLLKQQQTANPTQVSETNALNRLQQMANALQVDPSSPSEDDPGGGDQSGGQSGNPQQGPRLQLAELKLLRAMQADLNERTEAAVTSPEQFAEEQGYLAQLVLEILSRNNENSSPEVDNDTKGLQELFEQFDRELPD
jgi:hypothetical protein